LERALPHGISYTGVDVASDLVAFAKSHSQHEKHVFLVSDVTRPLTLTPQSYDRATIILALQNMENWEGVFDNMRTLLKVGGRAVIVLNHPYFRIPRQTAWGEDERTKQQYRKVFRYMSQMEIPIEMDPGRGGKKITWSYHRPITELVSLATSRGMVISGLEEWSSDKVSAGPKAKMENRARQEIPLFMALSFKKE
jgi:SAM-dependent methyltransferase